MKSYLILSLCLLVVTCTVTENMKKCWQFFLNKGITKEGAAGLLGNLQAESAVRPDILEKSKQGKLRLTSKEYIKKVNDGTYKNFVSDRAGFGLVQWTYPTRKKNLLNHCRGRIADLICQLEFLIIEIKSYKTVYKTITTSHSVDKCARIIMLNYEKPGNTKESNIQKRISMSKKIYKEMISIQERGQVHTDPKNEQPKPTGETEQSDQPSDKRRTYTVVRGDTLTRIAKRFNTTIKRLCELNNIADPNKIRVGQVLKID